MPVSAATLQLLIDAGLKGDHLLAIVASIDADMGGKAEVARTSRQERNARYYARKKDERLNKTSENRLNKTSESVLIEADSDSSRARVLCGEESIIKKPSPSGEGKKVSSKSKRAKSRLAENWKLDEIDLGYARQCGMTEPEARLEAEKFKNRHDSVGSLMADWRAAWRTWCGNWQTWRKPNGRPQTPNVLPFGPDPPRREFSDAEKREAAERWKQELAKQATQ